MTAIPVSVVVVSRGRPGRLGLCLTGLARLFYTSYEIIVVADAPGLGAVRALGLEGEVKTVPFDEANISAARNAGIAQAAGEVVAFLDDDAVPEPTWLHHLAAPFADPHVGAAGGFVRGRNGISFQYRARSVDGTGQATALDVDAEAVTLLHPAPGRAIKTEGTNMAVRRDLLARIGGFDPLYRFYLDETDLNMRLARLGVVTAIVPQAEVHHAYAGSARRRDDRAPRDLVQKAASLAVYLGRYCDSETRAALWLRLRAEERANALRHMVAGRLEPRDVRRLLAGFDAGRAEGEARRPQPMPALPRAADAFRAFATRARSSSVLAGRPWQARRLRAEARRRSAEGEVVTLYLLSPTALFHRLRMEEGGIWVQTGGIFGRAMRHGPLVKLCTFGGRLRIEEERIAGRRRCVTD